MQLTQIPLIMGEIHSVAVSNAALRVLGTTGGVAGAAAAWDSTLPTPNAGKGRIVHITNCSATLGLYVGVIDKGAVPAVTTASFGKYLPPLGDYEYFVPAGYELNAIRGSSSTDVVRAREYVWR